MKIDFQVGNIESETVKMKDVHVGVQFTADELVKEYGLAKTIVKDVPEIIKNAVEAYSSIKTAQETVDKLEEKGDEKNDKHEQQD